ncbi:MAG: integrin alpha, partial [Wenzhouxiangellaceae bacterium]
MLSANRSSPNSRRRARDAEPIHARRPARRPLATAISALLLGGALQAQAQSFPLSSIDGSNGFRLDGVAANDRSGLPVSAAGDVNGDGFDDVLIAARFASPNGLFSGSSYVVFGQSTGFPEAIDLADLDGSNGFRLDGVQAGDLAGSSVSAAG